MNMLRLRWLAAVFLWPLAVVADESGHRLDRMNAALSSLNYQGVFLQLSDGNVEPMQVIHRVDDGSAIERLVALDGVGREIISDGTEVVCIFPDQRTVLIEIRENHRPLMGTLPSFSDEARKNYLITESGTGELMGRQTHVIDVTPKDAYRYGYRLWLDDETGIPLKSMVRDQNGATLEQVRFASIEFPDQIPESAVKPAIDVTGFRIVKADQPQTDAESAGEPGWHAGQLPSGFLLSAYGLESQSQADQPVVHIVYSDGLASVSVFVEKPRVDEKLRGGLSRIGSAHAYSRLVDDHLVTAIGEVPPVTVTEIANSVVSGSANRK